MNFITSMKSIIYLVLVFVFFGCLGSKETSKPEYGSDRGDGAFYPLSCCQECVNSFGQSPVGVGEGGAVCGQFTTSYGYSSRCQEYFRNNTFTVAQCRLSGTLE